MLLQQLQILFSINLNTKRLNKITLLIVIYNIYKQNHFHFCWKIIQSTFRYLRIGFRISLVFPLSTCTGNPLEFSCVAVQPKRRCCSVAVSLKTKHWLGCGAKSYVFRSSRMMIMLYTGRKKLEPKTIATRSSIQPLLPSHSRDLGKDDVIAIVKQFSCS